MGTVQGMALSLGTELGSLPLKGVELSSNKGKGKRFLTSSEEGAAAASSHKEWVQREGSRVHSFPGQRLCAENLSPAAFRQKQALTVFHCPCKKLADALSELSAA